MIEKNMQIQAGVGKPESLRHRWEMPLIWLSFLITVVSIAFALVFALLDDAEINAIFGDAAETISDYAGTALAVLVLPVSIFLYRFYMAAKARSNAILVGPDQFPWIWSIYQELGEKLEMPRLPKLYVTNGNGVVNAYALSCNKRHKYIVIHAEIAMLAKSSPEIVEFVLAHEMAHHKLHHVSLWRFTIGIIPNLLVPLGITVTRAQEYSADRVAMSVCHHHQGAMSLLTVGPWMQGEVDPEVWLQQCDDERREFYVKFANTLSDHAVMSKRYKALRDIEEHGFCKHGEMI